MTTLKKVAIACLVAVLVLAAVVPLFGQNTTTSASTGAGGHNSRVLLDDLPALTPTPTSGAGTDSNPSGGGSGGG